MTKVIKKEGKILYQCEACGFHYDKEKTAKKCEEWCEKNHSCNLEITKDALENRKNGLLDML